MNTPKNVVYSNKHKRDILRADSWYGRDKMVGRNDPCPCGSGKKYKKCCMNKDSATNLSQAIESVFQEEQYETDICAVITNLLRYMKKNNWIGACHATSSVLYVALSELGYSPRICYGEIEFGILRTADHSWIELDGKIIDLACYMTLIGGIPIANPVILGRDVVTRRQPNIRYGISDGHGLDMQTRMFANMVFAEYMDNFPDEKNGLWEWFWKLCLPDHWKLIRCERSTRS